MVKAIEGVYENGIIKPSEPIQLENDSKVLITIFTTEDHKPLSLDLLTPKELFELAKKRIERLQASGISRSEVVNEMQSLLDEIREEALSKHVAVDEDDLGE